MKLHFSSAMILGMAYNGILSSTRVGVTAFSSTFGRRMSSTSTHHINELNIGKLALSSVSLPFQTDGAIKTPAKRKSSGASSLQPSTRLYMSESSKDTVERPFPTWTFDAPCDTMEWNQVSSAKLSVDVEAAVTIESVEDADLVILGIRAPATDDDEEEEDKSKEEEDEVIEPVLTGLAKELDEGVLAGSLTSAMMDHYKTFQNGAKAGTALPTLNIIVPGQKAKKYILLGLGKEGKEASDDDLFTKIGSMIASKCNDEKKVSKCTVILPSSSDATNFSDLSTSFYTTLYSDNRYRTGDKIKLTAKDLESVAILTESTMSQEEATDAIEAGKYIAQGVFLTKDIVNAPHNVLNSLSLANTAKEIAAQSDGRITCTILNKEECEARGMGAYLGVARGSETDPYFIHLAYTPKEGKASKKIGVVGKGLLFDTGGYNIKTAMMELMKFDCGGAAAVLGAARAVGALAPDDVEAHFIVAACENMINQKAVVPSDILTASNGKTIEVINTDAEGRLTLADALVYADKEVGCESIIELSTLTGACMVSLGKSIAGVWTSNDDLANELENVSKVTGDKSWRMPLEKSYNDQIESKIADIKNCGTRYGGAITAALFLENFVNKKKPFAHIDIAGPVWSDKVGATGFGAKMVTEWVVRQGKKE